MLTARPFEGLNEAFGARHLSPAAERAGLGGASGIPIGHGRGLDRVRWYRSSGATQRGGENLQIELADNTTSKFLR